MKQDYRLDLDDVMDLERTLSSPLFMGVPIGPTLASLATIEFVSNHIVSDWRYLWLHQLKRAYHTLRPLRRAGPPPILSSGRVLLTATSPSPRYLGLVVPVARQLGAERCVVLCMHQETQAMIPKGIPVIGLRDALEYDVPSWRRDFLAVWPELRSGLISWMSRTGLPRNTFARLADAVLAGSQLIAGFAGFLAAAEIRAVVVEHDRMQNSACLAMAARIAKTPSFTLVHGVMNEQAFGFVPILADRILCWGKLDRQILIDSGTESDRISIVGCPRMTPGLFVTRDQARRKVGLDETRPLVLLGTANFRADQRRILVDTFCKAVCDQSGFGAAIRLHPSENISDYEASAKAFPAVLFLQNDAWTLDEALAAADIVVIHNSGFGSDALIKGRPVIVLDCLDVPMGHGRLLVDKAECPVAHDARELREVIIRVLQNSGFRDTCLANAGRFASDFVSAMGDDSASQVVAAVLGNVP